MKLDRIRKLELLERSLGLRHKIKVHDSMKTPDTHEELALLTLSRWELEDELRAIEQILLTSRERNVLAKRTVIEGEPVIPPDLTGKKRKKLSTS